MESDAHIAMYARRAARSRWIPLGMHFQIRPQVLCLEITDLTNSLRAFSERFANGASIESGELIIDSPYSRRA